MPTASNTHTEMFTSFSALGGEREACIPHPTLMLSSSDGTPLAELLLELLLRICLQDPSALFCAGSASSNSTATVAACAIPWVQIKPLDFLAKAVSSWFARSPQSTRSAAARTWSPPGAQSKTTSRAIRSGSVLFASSTDDTAELRARASNTGCRLPRTFATLLCPRARHSRAAAKLLLPPDRASAARTSLSVKASKQEVPSLTMLVFCFFRNPNEVDACCDAQVDEETATALLPIEQAASSFDRRAIASYQLLSDCFWQSPRSPPTFSTAP
mmetsp:Transcript_53246/g.105820  ORF Transcript_53246/g.105820 Transcript_53246/m.105820 type:complete len:272 (+) Transcript_53246:141-956(+)